jgi:hypothetical protein
LPDAKKSRELVLKCAFTDIGLNVIGRVGQAHLGTPLALDPAGDAPRPPEPAEAAVENGAIRKLFTLSGSGLDNLFDYFAEMSYGAIDRSGVDVRGWFLVNKPGEALKSTDPAPKETRREFVQKCIDAAVAQDPSIHPEQYDDVVGIFNVATDGGNGGPYVRADPAGLYTSFMAQEVLHAIAQPLHSHREGCAAEYCDPWDEMSAIDDWNSYNPFFWGWSGFNGHMSANELVASNRIILGDKLGMDFVHPHDIAPFLPGGSVTETLPLVPINRDDLAGTRAVRVFSGDIYFTIELVEKSGWDSLVEDTGILIHTVDANGQVTQVPSPGAPQGEWHAGEVFHRGNLTIRIDALTTSPDAHAVVVVTVG